MSRRGSFALAVITLAVSAGCGSSGSARQTAAEPTTPSSDQSTVDIVAIGDSDATGIGDSTGQGWVGRYGALVKQNLNTRVSVDNLAVEGQTSEQLRANTASDDSLRQILGTADVVLIGIGGADLNVGDAALGAGQCNGRHCYAPVLRTFAANIDAIATEVRHISPTAVLRAMSLPNGFPGAGSASPPFATAALSLYQATAERAAVCQAMRSNNGLCIDVIRAFNGPKANADAYARGLMTKNPCCYPSAQGQQLIARLLLATGLASRHGAQWHRSTTHRSDDFAIPGGLR